MVLSEHVRSIQTAVAAIAALGDPATAAAGERIALALEGSIRSTLLDLVSEAALEVGAQLAEGDVSVRLDGGEPSLVYEGSANATPASEAPLEDDQSARITLRIGESLKARAEVAASQEGVSLNAWLVRAVSRAVDGRPSGQQPFGSGRRVQGWAES
jgi:hypothetical protein